MFVGFELSSGAAEEMTNPQKDVPKMILRSGLIAAAITGSMILGVLLVLNGDALSSVAGFPDAYNSVASVLGGAQTAFNWFICALIILTIISAGGVWQQGGVRIQAVAGLDGAAPLWFGKFSKQGTPLTMNILSAIIGSIFVVLVFLIAEGSLATFFGIMVSVIISLTAMMYVFQIPAVIMLRKKYPDHHRPFRVPGGRFFLWLCVIGAETIVIITIITLLWPGLLDNALGQPYDINYWWGVSRAYFETVTLGIVGFFLVMAVLFWAIGKRNIKKGLIGENDLLAIDPEALKEAQALEAGGCGRRAGARGGLMATAPETTGTRGGEAKASPPRQPLAPMRTDFPWRFHDEAGLEPLHEATLRLLETTGMRFESPKALAILKKAGAKVDEGSDLVRLPRRLVEEALAPAPRRVHARRPGRLVRPRSSARASPTAPPTAAAWRSSTGTPASAARPPRPTSRPSRACRTASAPSATGGRR